MGINVRVQKPPKPVEVILTPIKLESDLKSCMRCKFFYGSSRQCLAKNCVKEGSIQDIREQREDDLCSGCPYSQSEKYCFPCVKKLLGDTEKEIERKFALEQEEKKDG